MSTAIETSRKFRSTPIVDPLPNGWEPQGKDHRDHGFEPLAAFQELREEHENLRFALFSGGYDSLVAVHYAMERGEADAVLHANTLTAIPENTEFVKQVCQAYGWPLEIIDSPKTLEQFCLTTNNGDPYGFPSGAAHTVAFRWFKERAFRIAAKQNPARKPDLITGVRQAESERRMRTVSAEVQEVDRFIWKAPLWKKSDQWMADYMVEHGLPRSIVVEVLDRSGDCFCGAFADRYEELDRLQNPWDETHLDHGKMVQCRKWFGVPRLATFEEALQDHHDWLMAVEEQVQEEIGTRDGYCFWGHFEDGSEALRRVKAESDPCQVNLCEACSDGQGEPHWRERRMERETNDSETEEDSDGR